MTNARCYIPPSDWPLVDVTLGENESHHLLHVLRVKAGQKVEVFNGEGGTGLATVETTTRGAIAVRILERSEQKRPAVQLALIQALPREQKMDLIIQKATELGASEILPVTTEHAVVHLKQDRSEGKRERWEKIALNAAKQCGTAWLPKIFPAQALPAFLTARHKFDALLVCALDENARPIRDAIQSIKARPVSSVGVLVGPEGDFSAAEMESIRTAGAVPVSLGGSILRSETAAIYALSVLRYELL
jgi:16S rRNA (uracil1498-N3)-methyltransferase